MTETDSNYGFFLSLWDRWCGTYTAQPQHKHQGMTIGLSEYQSLNPAHLQWCLLVPFKTPQVKTITTEGQKR